MHNHMSLSGLICRRCAGTIVTIKRCTKFEISTTTFTHYKDMKGDETCSDSKRHRSVLRIRFIVENDRCTLAVPTGSRKSMSSCRLDTAASR